MSKNNGKPTIKDLQETLIILDQVCNALNTSVVALAYVLGVKGTELDKVSADDYVKFVAEHLHPLINRADEINKEYATKLLNEAKKEEKENK